MAEENIPKINALVFPGNDEDDERVTSWVVDNVFNGVEPSQEQIDEYKRSVEIYDKWNEVLEALSIGNRYSLRGDAKSRTQKGGKGLYKMFRNLIFTLVIVFLITSLFWTTFGHDLPYKGELNGGTFNV